MGSPRLHVLLGLPVARGSQDNRKTRWCLESCNQVAKSVTCDPVTCDPCLPSGQNCARGWNSGSGPESLVWKAIIPLIS